MALMNEGTINWLDRASPDAKKKLDEQIVGLKSLADEQEAIFKEEKETMKDKVEDVEKAEDELVEDVEVKAEDVEVEAEDVEEKEEDVVAELDEEGDAVEDVEPDVDATFKAAMEDIAEVLVKMQSQIDGLVAELNELKAEDAEEKAEDIGFAIPSFSFQALMSEKSATLFEKSEAPDEPDVSELLKEAAEEAEDDEPVYNGFIALS
jgi:hypothetical protein